MSIIPCNLIRFNYVKIMECSNIYRLTYIKYLLNGQGLIYAVRDCKNRETSKISKHGLLFGGSLKEVFNIASNIA